MDCVETFKLPWNYKIVKCLGMVLWFRYFSHFIQFAYTACNEGLILDEWIKSIERETVDCCTGNLCSYFHPGLYLTKQ